MQLKNLLLFFGYVQFPEEKQRQYFITKYSLHQKKSKVSVAE